MLHWLMHPKERLDLVGAIPHIFGAIILDLFVQQVGD